MELSVVLGLLGGMGAISGIVFAIASYKRSNKAENKDEGKSQGSILTELGYIKSGVDDIKRKQEKQDEQHIEVIERLSAVEQSTKQAHHRIDKLEVGDNK